MLFEGVWTCVDMGRRYRCLKEKLTSLEPCFMKITRVSKVNDRQKQEGSGREQTG